jgi:large subunit ribosomal protein LP0
MPAKAKSSRTKEQIQEKKTNYMTKVTKLLENYPRFLIVTCDNITSAHMQNIRLGLRSVGAVLLMGKNTLMRRVIRDHLTTHPNWEPLLSALKGNVGLIFSKGPLTDLRDEVNKGTVPASAKAGAIAPIDVILPKQVTTLEPTKTSFFAALDIATKITKGCVEILNDVRLCEKAKKVGSSEAALLAMLDIRPFVYGLIIVNCFDGSLFPPNYLDFSESDLFKAISSGISNVAAMSLALSYPSLPAFPHVITTAFRNLVAISIETGYDFPQAEKIKNMVQNPEAFAAPKVVEQPKVEVNKKPDVVKDEPKPKPSSSSSVEDDGEGLMDFF